MDLDRVSIDDRIKYQELLLDEEFGARLLADPRPGTDEMKKVWLDAKLRRTARTPADLLGET